MNIFTHPHKKLTTLGPRPSVEEVLQFMRDNGQDALEEYIMAQAIDCQDNLYILMHRANLMRGHTESALKNPAPDVVLNFAERVAALPPLEQRGR